MKNTAIVVSPTRVPVNATITIRANETFPDNTYQITDESGKMLRRGSISKNICEFYLSVAGMSTGNYRLVMGSLQERFKVI